MLRMSDSDEQYEVPSGGNDEENNKIEVNVTEIVENKGLDAESKTEGEKPDQDENITQHMKLLAVIDQKRETKSPTKPADKGSTSIIGNIQRIFIKGSQID